MREKLISYVNLLFAGTEGVEDIQQEILQNTLDRFDDLVSRGSTPENAYRQAIAGIGDVNAILGGEQPPEAEPDYNPLPEFEGTAPAVARMMRAVAIFLYIVSPVPLILLDSIGWDDAGVCILLVIVAIATLLLLTFRDNKKDKKATQTSTSNSGLEKSIKKLMRTVALVLFFLVSFATGAWVVTWLIFPIEKALEGVVCAALDLKGED